MKRSMISVMSVAVVLLACAAAQASLSWQTQPILGYSSSATGDVEVVTNAGVVTIPHYSIIGDPLFGVGGPGVSTFDIGETVANGSGINVDFGNSYHVVGVYSFLGASPRSLVSDVFDYTATSPDNFVMNYSYISDPAPYGAIYNFVAADVGDWTYTETWTNNAQGVNESITSTVNFKVIPEPASVAVWGLLGLVVAGCGLWRRKRAA